VSSGGAEVGQLIAPLEETALSAARAAAPAHKVGSVSSAKFNEVVRFQNHLCQIVWSLSFAGWLFLDEARASAWKALMLCTGAELDAALVGQGAVPQPGPTTTTDEEEEGKSAPQGGELQPRVVLSLAGIAVVLKPPGWEVDAKGQLCRSGLHLSHFMQRVYGSGCSPLLTSAAFEYGFVHRLDVPSSGLVLAGTSFEGYALLQWEMHTYSIEREYVVLLGGLPPATGLETVEVPIQDMLPSRSFVDFDGGRPAKTFLKALLHSERRGTHSRGPAKMYNGLVAITIHTGRRHQIRVHTQWSGFPTVTDEKYAHRRVLVRQAVGEAWPMSASGSHSPLRSAGVSK